MIAEPAATRATPSGAHGLPVDRAGEERGDDRAEDEHRRDVDRLRAGERRVPGRDVRGEEQAR